MKATIARESFTRAYQAVSACVPRSSPKAVLQSIRFDAAIGDGSVLIGTDLDVGMRYSLSGLNVERPGSVLLPPCFGDVLRTCHDTDLSLDLNDGNLTVRGLHSEFTLATEDANLFPDVLAFQSEDCYECDAAALAEAIGRTVFCCDPESTRYALGGLLFELESVRVNMVGTDGRRLARTTIELVAIGTPKPPQVPPVVSIKTLKLITRLAADSGGALQFCFDGQSIQLKGEHATVSGQLVEGRFPRYQDVFPSGKVASITIESGPFRQAVDQASIATSEESRGVDFTFEQGQLVLKSQAAVKGASKVSIPLAYDGPTVELTIDPHYLSQGLKTLPDDSMLSLELFGPDRAIMIQIGSEWCYVLMPLTRGE